MNYLHKLGNNEENAKAVREYLLKVLHEKAGNDALNGIDTSGYQEAKNIINLAINHLVEEYGDKKEVQHKPRI